MKCPKCKYSTSCLRAMISHNIDCVGTTSELTNLKTSLGQEMHCICGFSSSEGNALARHLMTCGRSTAYPTVEAAQENTVQRNMLDMLGLVRRDEDDDEEESLAGGDGALLETQSGVAQKESDEPEEASSTAEQVETPIEEPMEVEEEPTKDPSFNAALSLDDMATLATTAELDQTTPICNNPYQPELVEPHVAIEGDVDQLQKQQILQFMESL